MEYYIIPYIFLAFWIVIFVKSKIELKKYTLFLFICTLPAAFIAIFSGDVGTDKGYYYTTIYRTLHWEFSEVNYEFGFKVLNVIIGKVISEDVFVIIPVISTITYLFLIFSFSKNKFQLTVFSFLVFPFFFYDMTMNGLRYGLSFAIAAYASYQLIRNKRTKLFFILAILATSIQYSSFLILVVIYLSQVKLQRKHLLILILFFGILYKILDFSYFDNKVDTYKELNSPSGISGLSPLVIFVLIFIINYVLNKGNKINKFFYVLLILEVLSFVLSLVSYSGLRFQNLVIFAFLILMANQYEFEKYNGKFIFVFFIVGCLCLGLKIRNFMNEDELVETPFLPYEFYWERK